MLGPDDSIQVLYVLYFFSHYGASVAHQYQQCNQMVMCALIFLLRTARFPFLQEIKEVASLILRKILV